MLLALYLLVAVSFILKSTGRNKGSGKQLLLILINVILNRELAQQIGNLLASFNPKGIHQINDIMMIMIKNTLFFLLGYQSVQ